MYWSLIVIKHKLILIFLTLHTVNIHCNKVSCLLYDLLFRLFYGVQYTYKNIFILLHFFAKKIKSENFLRLSVSRHQK